MINVRLQIDGIDKTGKDLIVNYITRLSNHKYVIQSRGIISQIAYSKRYNRNYEYNLDAYKNDLIYYLFADKEDLEIRHKITNEPKIDIETDLKIFDETVDELIQKGIPILKFNTSAMTPYMVAKFIIDHAERRNEYVQYKR